MKNNFKTLDEQISILKDRGLIINDNEEAKGLLLRYNYYKIVNATQSYFTDINDSNKFIKGTNFDDLISVHNFDKNVKKILLSSMIEIERILRSILSYKFSMKYTDKYSYLNENNFSSENIHFVRSNIEVINEILVKHEETSNFKRSVIYYKNKYGEVPFWFIVNFISFGKLVNIFETLDLNLKEEIADEFQKFLEENIGGEMEKHLTPKQLFSYIKNARDIRNVCAHDNLILESNFEQVEYIKEIHSKYELREDDVRNRLFDSIYVFSVLLPKIQFENLISELNREFSTLERSIDKRALDKILDITGIKNYRR